MYVKNTCVTALATLCVFGEGVQRYNLTLTYAWDKQGAA